MKSVVFATAAAPLLLLLLLHSPPSHAAPNNKNNNNSITPFVVGGEDAEKQQFPEIVSLQFNGNMHLCGGVIIDEHWILTAAHCLEDAEPNEVTILAGTKDHYERGTRMRVAKFELHDDYRTLEGGSLTHDIALIKLEDAIPLNEDIRLATLQKESPSEGDEVVVAGWGRTESSDPTASRKLQYAEIAVISKEDCKKAYEDYTEIVEDQICTFSDGSEAECKGDSGGPLFSNGWVVGLVSWSKKPCGTHPGVYASVPYHYDWIKEKTGISNL